MKSAGSGGIKPRGERTCLGCRQVFRQEKLLRFVLSADGELLVDYRAKLPGRGAYTCLNRECIRLAVEKRQFERSFKRPVLRIENARLVESLTDQISCRVKSLLGMARKSSNAISGSSAVMAALGGREQICLLFLATDISEAIGEKIRKKAFATSVPCVVCFDKVVMGNLMGRSERSVIGIRNKLLADSIGIELGRLELIAGEG